MDLDMLEKVTGGANAPDDKEAMETWKAAWSAKGLDSKYTSHVRNQVGDNWIKEGCIVTAEDFIDQWLKGEV